MRGEAEALMSDRIEERSDSRRSEKCEASFELAVLMSSSVGREVAVVSQRPGS